MEVSDKAKYGTRTREARSRTHSQSHETDTRETEDNTKKLRTRDPHLESVGSCCRRRWAPLLLLLPRPTDKSTRLCGHNEVFVGIAPLDDLR